MKYWQGLIFYLVAMVLQPFFQNLIPTFGGNLNLILVLTVIFVFVFEDITMGILYGAIFALAADIFYGMYMGPGMVAMVVCGLLTFFLKKFANVENVFNALITMVITTWVYASVYWGIYYFIGSPYTYLYAMKSLPLQLLFNTMVAMVLYFILIKRVMKHKRDRYFK